MTAAAVLAVSASRCTGPSPFSLALSHGGRVDADSPDPGGHADLPARVVGLCRRAGIAPRQLTELRIDIGPGSYVGLRVAVTLARFLHRETGAQLLAANSLALMACATSRDHAMEGTTVHVLLDARRGRWHAQTLRIEDQRVVPASQPQALPPADILAGLTAGCVVLADPGLHQALAQVAAERRLRLVAPKPVEGITLFDARLGLEPCAAADLEPLYLMGTYADEPRT